MTFTPTKWFPIAAILSALNVIAVPFATGAVHTTSHAVLALAFGLWAQKLGQQLRRDRQAEQLADGDARERLDSLEGEMTSLRRELTEAQERLDFTERMLAQGREARR